MTEAGAYQQRRERAVAQAAEAGLAGLLITPGPDLVYFTGYRPTAATERLTMLVLSAGRDPHLILPLLERPDAEAAPGAPLVTLIAWRDGDDPYSSVAGLLNGGGRYVLSDSAWAMHLIGVQAAAPRVRCASMNGSLPMLRAIKDEAEVALLAAAGAAADAAYEKILGVRFAGRTEKEIGAELARLLREFGHSQVDFTVVGSGPNGADPHHEVGDRRIREGDMVVLDFGGLKDGYGSDTTRTVHVGQPSAIEREVFDVVRSAQQAAFAAVRPGVACQEIDRVARDRITEAGYGDYFIHRVGHGIGLTTHEPPHLVRGEEHPLLPGMCFSIEPGIYLPGRFGVRIEDIVTVAPYGGRRLNNTDHALQVVS
jgi:Xaa-Pro aminopeptidase